MVCQKPLRGETVYSFFCIYPVLVIGIFLGVPTTKQKSSFVLDVLASRVEKPPIFYQLK